MSNDKNSSSASGCGCIVLILNVLLGAWSVNYLMASLLAKSVPLWVAFIGGLFLGQFTIPAAIICWILRVAGVEVPFIK